MQILKIMFYTSNEEKGPSAYTAIERFIGFIGFIII